MVNILCYGDSNTFGWDPEKEIRLGKHERWTGVVQKELGDSFNIIEDGLPGRTTVWYDPVMNLISGVDYLFPCLSAHQPLDMVVVMLGTNDLKYMFSATPFDVFWGMERLLKIICDFRTEFTAIPPKVFLISPPLLIEPKAHFMQMFKEAEEKSKTLANDFQKLSLKYDTLFLDASTIVKPSKTDGIHLNCKSHTILGKQVALQIKEYYAK